jgi:hypothetical protein
MDDDEDEFDCFAEMIDGSYTFCGCPDCNDREREEQEAALEYSDGE